MTQPLRHFRPCFFIPYYKCDHLRPQFHLASIPLCPLLLLAQCFQIYLLYFLNIYSDLDVLTSHLNDQLHNFSTWLKANKLSTNVKKTKRMIFRTWQKTLPITRQIKKQAVNRLFLQIKSRRILDILCAFLIKRLFHSRMSDVR